LCNTRTKSSCSLQSWYRSLRVDRHLLFVFKKSHLDIQGHTKVYLEVQAGHLPTQRLDITLEKLYKREQLELASDDSSAIAPEPLALQ